MRWRATPGRAVLLWLRAVRLRLRAVLLWAVLLWLRTVRVRLRAESQRATCGWPT